MDYIRARNLSSATSDEEKMLSQVNADLEAEVEKTRISLAPVPSTTKKIDELQTTVKSLNAKLEAAGQAAGLPGVKEATGERSPEVTLLPSSSSAFLTQADIAVQRQNSVSPARCSSQARSTATANNNTIFSPYVEDLQLPSPSTADLTAALPETANPWAVLKGVVAEKEQIYVSRRARMAIREWFMTQNNVQMLTDLFWWFCADIFKKHDRQAKRLKEILFARFSRQYLITNIPAETGTRPSDTYIHHYPPALAESVYFLFCNCFPKSTHKFDAVFRKRILNQILSWSTGLLPHHAELRTEIQSAAAPASGRPNKTVTGGAGGVGSSIDTGLKAAAGGGRATQVQLPPAIAPGDAEHKIGVPSAAISDSGSDIMHPARLRHPGYDENTLEFDLHQTSPFLDHVMATFNLKPDARMQPLAVSRTLPPLDDDEDEETYGSFARKASSSNSQVKQYGRVKRRVKHDITVGRLGTNVELAELEEYRKMVALGTNTRKFSNWLSQWTDAEAGADPGGWHDDSSEGDSKTSGRRVKAVVRKKMGGGAHRVIGAGKDSRDVMARNKARQVGVGGGGSLSASTVRSILRTTLQH